MERVQENWKAFSLDSRLRGNDGRRGNDGKMGVLGKILASIAAIFTQMAAASPGKVGGMGGMDVAAPVLATLAAPFLWVMSLLISGQVYGLTFVRTAPTLETRRWLVRQLFYGYSLVCVGPVAVLTVLIHLNFVYPATQQLIFSIGFALLGATSLVYYFQATYFYRKLCILNEAKQFPLRNKPNLGRIIYGGFIIASAIVRDYMWLYIHDVCTGWGAANHGVQFVVFTVIAGMGVIHAASFSLFRYFLRISKNEEVFAATPPIKPSENAVRNSGCVMELLRVLPFALFPIAFGIGHILTKNTHPVCSLLEMAFFMALWTMVWRKNVQIEDRKWFRILTLLIIQTTMMYFIRVYFFNV